MSERESATASSGGEKTGPPFRSRSGQRPSPGSRPASPRPHRGEHPVSDPSNPRHSDNRDSTDDGADGERRDCAVCGRILNAYVSPEGERSWLHTFADLPEDHPAVPVGTGEIIPQPRCDFCSAEHPTWELPARSFVIPDLTLGQVENGSHGNWAACDSCAQLIGRDQWTALRRRALTAWSDPTMRTRSTGSAVAGDVDRQLSQLYRLLRRNITGPLRLLRPPDRP